MNGFQYQLVGVKHAAMLMVSLYSLRKYHKEPIQIVCGDDAAFEVVTKIILDKALDPIDWVCWNAPLGSKGRQHANKATGVTYSPFDKTIFLDADTSVHGNLDELWPESEEVHLTRFVDWVTTGNMMRGRLQAWYKVLPERVQLMQNKDYPALNTGVFSFSKDSTKYLEDWRKTTEANPIFMADELAAQLIFIDHPHRIHSDRWNYSPKYSTPSKETVKVIHYHGFQNARPDKSDGWKTWTKLFRECYLAGRCGIRSIDFVNYDKHLRKWLNENPNFLKSRVTI